MELYILSTKMCLNGNWTPYYVKILLSSDLLIDKWIGPEPSISLVWDLYMYNQHSTRMFPIRNSLFLRRVFSAVG